MRTKQNKQVVAALGRLQQRRRELALSQAAVAEAIGVNASYIGLLERGQRYPSLDVLLALCSALDLAPAALFEEHQKGSPRTSREVQQLVAVMKSWGPKKRKAIVKVAKALADLDDG